MTDGFGIDELEARIDALRDTGVTFEMNKLNKEAQEILKYISKMWDATVKGDKPTQKELSELKKIILSYYQSSKTSTKDTRTYLSQWFQQLTLRLDKLEKNRFMHSFNANTSNQVSQGVLNPNKKDAEQNILAQLLSKGFVNPMMKTVDSAVDKLLNFLGTDRDSRKTRMRQFREDLVEGLSRSKFFGGAIMDLVKLGALWIASWAKDKGVWGKVLAVGLVAAAPVLGAMLVKALVGAFVTGIAKVAGFIGGLFMAPIRWLGRTMAGWVTRIVSAIWMSRAFSGVRGGLSSLGFNIGGRAAQTTASTIAGNTLVTGVGSAIGQQTAQAGANVGKTALMKSLSPGSLLKGGLIGAGTGIATTLGAYTAVEKGADPRLAHGLSGAAQGGVLAAQIFRHPAAIAIGAVLGGLIGLIKGHYDKQESLGEEQLKELKEGGGKGGFWGGKEGRSGGISFGQDSVKNATLNGRQISSGFGWRTHPVYGTSSFHSGIDLKYSQGEAVNAFMGGKVISAQWQQGFGNTVRVQDKNGKIHVYGHLDSLGVKAGQEIRRGQYLGGAGSTGTSTGTHLHYGVANDTSWAKSSYVDPIAYLRAYEPDALNKGEKKGLKYKDKTTQNIVDYWDSQGKDKGWLRFTAQGLRHSKADDYAKLAEEYKQEYARSQVNDIFDPKDPLAKLKHDERMAIAASSKEAKDYANRKIADYVKNAKEEAVATATQTSIAIKYSEAKGDIKDLTPSATEQARAQWSNINKEFREEAEKQIIIPPDKQPLIDFSGSETCSKVLKNVIDAQQQAYRQQ